jgi:RHS repeat-associated protein
VRRAPIRYDALNRVISRVYSNDPQSTPAVTYTYDDPQVSNAKGRLTKVVSSVSTTEYTQYDPLGRVKGSRQTTSGASQAYQMSYGYNLAGLLVSASYPSGRVVTTSYDGAGRLNTVNGQKAGELNKSYAAGFSYTAAGAVSAMQMGNGLVEQTTFNARLQPVQIKLGTVTSPSSVVQLDYGYGTTNNNGNLLSQTITAPKTAGGSLVLTQTYGYDALNRLVSAGENGTAWQQTYDCDRFGNRAVRATSYIPSPQLTPQSASLTDFSAFDQSTNRLSVTKYPQVLYDGAGNLKRDQVGSTFTYDGENRQVSASGGGVSSSYFYDGDGRRVKKVVGTVTTLFVYNASGQLVAEYMSDPVPPPAGGGGTSYLTADTLGSTRVVTKSDGAVKARYDYLPFGEELPSTIGGRSGVTGYGSADSTRQKFTAKERDVESGLDYFLARYYSAAQGRFTSVDPYNIVAEIQNAHDKKEAQKQFRTYLGNPQRWNRYSYGLNNPLFYTDPNGEDVTIYYRPPNENSGSKEDQGHIFIYVRNDETGESAYLDYYPDPETGSTVIGNMNQERIANHSSITIETNAEQEQAILDRVKDLMKSAPDANYNTTSLILSGGTTCVSNSRDALSQGGINITSIAPKGVWMEAFGQYASRDNNPLGWHTESGAGIPIPKAVMRPDRREYGHDPRGQARRLDNKAVNVNNKLYFKGGVLQKTIHY